MQLLKDGTLHTINIPGACTAAEAEKFQELAQNTNFGTTNLSKDMTADALRVLQEAHYSSEKIVGGAFDGLSMAEAHCLRAKGFPGDGLTAEEIDFLEEEAMCFPPVPARRVGVGIIGDGRPSRSAPQQPQDLPPSARPESPSSPTTLGSSTLLEREFSSPSAESISAEYLACLVEMAFFPEFRPKYATILMLVLRDMFSAHD